ncbi:MAG: phospholipase [Rhodoferax sp.]|nr:phospholipase [Rhodoferax sp.]
MQALHIHAGPTAMRHIARHGLQAADVGVVAGAAGGPKGLILGPLDRFLFGDWLHGGAQAVHLVGASIGAWRMATACLDEPVAAFRRLEHDYIHQHYEPPPGRSRPTPEQVSDRFGASLRDFFGGHEAAVLGQRRYRLHVLASRGRHLLARESAWRTPLGYAAAYLCNAVNRRALGAWLERVVLSSPGAVLPFDPGDFPTRRVALTPANLLPALQASCSIPFVLRAVADLPGSAAGAHWDGGITDYHLHLDYARAARPEPGSGPLVLYPHFQQAVVPGWLDKALRWRHRPTGFLDNLVLLAPRPDWVARLPGGKLPDRTDFTRFGADLPARVAAWSAAVSESRRLADEFQAWLARPDPGQLRPL